MPEVYTDSQIKDYATKLGAAGAEPAKIRAFVEHAKATQVDAPESGKLLGGRDAQIGPANEKSLLQKINDSDLRTQLIGPSENTLMKQGQDRAWAGDELRVQSPDERGALPSLQAAAREPLALFSRAFPALLSAEGGPTGAALNSVGEAAGQLIDPRARMSPSEILAQRDAPVFDKGRLASAGIIGAIPLGSTVGVLSTLKNAAKLGAGGYVGEQARSLIDEGKVSPDANRQGATMASIAAAIPLASKVAGAAGARFKGPATNNPALADAENAFIKARKLGVTVNPADLNQSTYLQDKLTGIEAMKKDVQARNVSSVQTSVREDIGLPPTTTDASGVTHNTIRPENIEAAQKAAMVPYNKVAALSTDASDALANMKQARADAREAYKAWLNDSTGNPESLAKMKDTAAARDAAETRMELHAETTENPKLIKPLKDLTQAESDIAKAKSRFDQIQLQRKSYSMLPNYNQRKLSDALNPEVIVQPSGGNIDTASTPLAQMSPQEIAEMDKYNDAISRLASAKEEIAKLSTGQSALADEVKEGRKIYARSIPIDEATGIGNRLVNVGDLALMHQDNWTGNSDTLAKFKQAFPDAMTDPARVKNPAAGKLQSMMLASNLSHGNVPGILANGIPVIGDMIRKSSLSPASQDKLVKNILAMRSGSVPGLSRESILAMQRIAANFENLPDESDRSTTLASGKN